MAEQLDTTELRKALYNKVEPWVKRRDEQREQYVYGFGDGMSIKDWREWTGRRPINDEERKEHIKQHGLPAIIQYKETKHPNWKNDFFQIEVQPLPNFLSLDNPIGTKLRNMKHRDYNPFHVSIGHHGDYYDEHYDDYMRELQTIKDKYAIPKAHVFKIESFGGGNSANLDWDGPVQRDIHMLFNYGRYGRLGPRARDANYTRYQTNRPHISM